MENDRISPKRLGPFLVFLALAGTLETSCSSRSKGFLKKWEKQVLAPRVSPTLRKLASSSGSVCLKDQDSVSFLKEEIRQMEAQAGGPPIQGTWKHLDLSKLPRPQAAYLTRFPQWVETQGIDVSACQDLPCVLNKVYRSPSEEEGLRIYAWYLRMGNVLATAGRLPILPDREWPLNRELRTETFGKAPFQDYLFSRDELYGFGLLSKTLSPLYRDMPSLQSIHRVPHGFVYSKTPDSCGFAWGAKTIGNVRLLDRCLEFTDGPKSIQGFFYRGVPHELSHRLDAILGRKGDSLSEMDEWMSLSGWGREEAINPKNGMTEIHWKSDPAKDGFVRDYAGKSPSEDWADTAAHFRYEPETALRNSPMKSAFISQKLYGGRTFDPAGLLAYYSEQVWRGVSQDLPELVNTCVVGKSPDLATSASPLEVDLRFDFSIEPKIVECLKAAVAARLDAGIITLKQTEYEACDYFANNGVGFTRQVVGRLRPDLTALLSKQAGIADQLRALSGLRHDLDDSVDAREIFLQCFGKPESEACYLNAMTAAFSLFAKPYVSAIPTEGLEAESKNFLLTHSMDSANAAATGLFGNIFAGIEPKVRHFARKRWEECRFAPDGASVPKTFPFNGGTHYVSSGILDCINGAVDSDLDTLRDAFSAKLGISVSDPNAQAFVRSLWLPLYRGILDRQEQAEAQLEDAEREKMRPVAVSFIYKRLNSSSPGIKGACLEQAPGIFDGYLEEVSRGQALPIRFIAREDLRQQWVAEACKKIQQSPSPQSPLPPQRKSALGRKRH